MTDTGNQISNQPMADGWQLCDACSLEFPVSMMLWIAEGDMLVCERCGKHVVIKYDNRGNNLHEQEGNQAV